MNRQKGVLIPYLLSLYFYELACPICFFFCLKVEIHQSSNKATIIQCMLHVHSWAYTEGKKKLAPFQFQDKVSRVFNRSLYFVGQLNPSLFIVLCLGPHNQLSRFQTLHLTKPVISTILQLMGMLVISVAKLYLSSQSFTWRVALAMSQCHDKNWVCTLLGQDW